jgi:uncharacterized DUF497 family protein
LTFEWDEHNIGHIARHGVVPSEVEQAFRSGVAALRTEVVSGETRRHALGERDAGHVLYLIWTPKPRGRVRIVTAWPANRKTRSRYREWKEAQQ